MITKKGGSHLNICLGAPDSLVTPLLSIYAESEQLHICTVWPHEGAFNPAHLIFCAGRDAERAWVANHEDRVYKTEKKHPAKSQGKGRKKRNLAGGGVARLLNVAQVPPLMFLKLDVLRPTLGAGVVN